MNIYSISKYLFFGDDCIYKIKAEHILKNEKPKKKYKIEFD